MVRRSGLWPRRSQFNPGSTYAEDYCQYVA